MKKYTILFLLFSVSIFAQNTDCGDFCGGQKTVDLSCSSQYDTATDYTYSLSPNNTAPAAAISIDASGIVTIDYDAITVAGDYVLCVECECIEYGCKSEKCVDITKAGELEFDCEVNTTTFDNVWHEGGNQGGTGEACIHRACVGDRVQARLNNTGVGFTYVWQDITDPANPIPITTTFASGSRIDMCNTCTAADDGKIISVTVTDENGCTDEATYELQIKITDQLDVCNN